MTAPTLWVAALKEITSAGKVAIAVSPATSRSLRSGRDLEKVLEVDGTWTGEMLVGDSLVAAKAGKGTTTFLPLVEEITAPDVLAARMLSRLRDFSSLEEFEASELDFANVLATCLNWHGEKRDTKSVVKALAEAFKATTELDGKVISRFSQGVEMLSYISVIAPLLEADRLVRIISEAKSTLTAYDVPLSVSNVYQQLESTLSRYSQVRRERLLLNLWQVSHERRWWDLKRKNRLTAPRYEAANYYNYQGNLDNYTAARQAQEQELMDRVSSFWDGTTFTFPVNITTPEAWYQNTMADLRTSLMGVIVLLAKKYGQPVVDALLLQVDSMPDLETHTGFHKKSMSGRHRQEAVYALSSYSSTLATLKGMKRGTFSEIILIQAAEAKQHGNQYVSYMPDLSLLPFMEEETFKKAVALAGNLPDNRVHWVNTISEMKEHFTSEQMAYIFSQPSTKKADQTALAVEGFCSYAQFSNLLRTNTGALRKLSSKALALLVESKLATPEDTQDIIDALTSDKLSLSDDGLRMLGEYADRLGFDKVKDVYKGLRPTQKTVFLSAVIGETAALMLEDEEVEPDESIVAAGFLKRKELTMSYGPDAAKWVEKTKNTTPSLLKRMDSWRSCEDTLRVLSERPTMAAGADPADLARIIRTAANKELAGTFLKSTEAANMQMDTIVWIAAIEVGASLGGSNAVDTVAALGLLDDAGIKKLYAANDPDALVTIAFVPNLTSRGRPESVYGQLASQLLRDTADVSEWPEKPTSWESLIPQAGTKPYSLPDSAKALHKQEVPGVEGSVLTLIKTPLELHRNAEHMGNCSYGYTERVQAGHCLMFHVSYKGLDYNLAFNKYNAEWRLGELNSRFNGGNIPRELSAGCGKIEAML